MNPRKTPEQRALAGTSRRDRDERPAPAGTGIGTAPRHLGAELAKVWRELAKALPAGVGSLHDRPAFELLTRLVAKSREGKTTAAETAHQRGLFESFGLTPAGRHRLGIKVDGRSTARQGKARDGFDF